jgi:hypothetical protein
VPCSGRVAFGAAGAIAVCPLRTDCETAVSLESVSSTGLEMSCFLEKFWREVMVRHFRLSASVWCCRFGCRRALGLYSLGKYSSLGMNDYGKEENRGC